MLDTLGIFPKSVAPAAVAYLLVSYGLGEVFSNRMARWVHIPRCEAALVSAASEAEFGRDLQAKLAQRLLENVMKSFPPISQNPLLRDLPSLAVAQQPRSSADTFAGRCACLASAARTETRFDRTVWVASLRFIKPAGVTDFDGVMTRLHGEGVCKGRA